MKNLVLISICFLSAIQLSYGQLSFSHSLGASYYYSSSAAAPGAMYSPRLNFLSLGKEATLSIGTHLGLGFALNSREGGSSLALDIPLVAEVNFGHAAHTETESSFGGFAGAGYGISKIGSSDGTGSGYNDAAGIVFNAGIRGLIRGRSVGLRASYLLNTKSGASNVLGVGVFYTFGQSL